MSKVDRNNPKRSTASESRYTLFEFERDFPDDAACLAYLVAELYPDGIFCPKCDRVTKHHREKSRPSYSCQFCGHREHPMKGTIFQDSATSLRLWFYAIYLMASTRCGISAKQLERELGVTYKTAYRMFKQIRPLFEQDTNPFTGAVEANEAYAGGRMEWKRARGKQGRPGKDSNKTPVFGIAQRKTADAHGRIYANVVENSAAASLMPHI
jgi:transposase